jgi:hypothetical protein
LPNQLILGAFGQHEQEWLKKLFGHVIDHSGLVD